MGIYLHRINEVSVYEAITQNLFNIYLFTFSCLDDSIKSNKSLYDCTIYSITLLKLSLLNSPATYIMSIEIPLKHNYNFILNDIKYYYLKLACTFSIDRGYSLYIKYKK